MCIEVVLAIVKGVGGRGGWVVAVVLLAGSSS